MARPTQDGQMILVFDGNCGFCTLAVRFLRSLDGHQRIRPMTCQKRGLPESLGLTREQCEQAVWAVVGGRRYRGAEAIDHPLATAVGLPHLARLYRIPLIRQAQDLTYRWVARNRSRLPAVTPHCRQHPEDCHSRPERPFPSPSHR